MTARFVKSIFGISLFCVLVFSVSGLSALELENFLDQEEFNWDGACYLLLTQAGEIDPDALWEESFLSWRDREGWATLVKGDWNSSPTLGVFALMAYEVLPWKPESMFFSFFPSPRNAARELINRGWLPGAAHSGRSLNAEEVIYIINQLELFRRSRES